MSRAHPALPGDQHEAFAHAVRAAFGLVFPPSRRGALDQGVTLAAASIGASVPALLASLEAGDPRSRDAVVAHLTVGETYLFRDDAHFAFVRDVALPEARRRGGRVRLWSAGCATGEEAWSLAIAAREALGRAAIDQVEVIGTDLNESFLGRAREGWYGAWSFRGVDRERQTRWFTPERGGWRVAAELRGAVRFAPLNLLDPGGAWPSEVDVILCRNVAIYFDLETVAQVGARLAGSLREGGWLVPGPSDPLLPSTLGLVATLRGPLVYRRGEAPTAPAPLAPPSLAPLSDPPPAPPRRAPAPSLQPAVVAPAPSPTDLDRARALADAGDLAGASRLLDAAVQRDGLAPGLYVLRSSVRASAGDDAGARDDAARAVLLDRRLAFAHLLLAAAHARLDDAPAALRALRNARSLLRRGAPDAPVAHAGAQTRAALLDACDRLARALGAPPRARGARP